VSGKRALLLCCLAAVCSTRSVIAQELEPRAYAASPVGVNFLVVAAGHSTGGVLVDPSLPIEDVEASVNSLSLGYGRTLNVFGRTGLLVAALPYAWLDATGRVDGETGHVSRSGLADPRIKLSVNLVGGPAMNPSEFARAARPTIVGVSLGIAPPLGRYDPTRLINLGANRWSFKPEVGVSRQLGRWTVEGYAGAWLFTANDAFYTGNSIRTQRPIAGIQGHVSYSVKPRLWIAFDATWYSGGRTRVNGVEKADLQRNSRVGATVSVPFARQQSLKIVASTGATTRIGANFKTVVAAWQFTWFD
jgi:Putative MetA-pathway of phenol degradation